MRYCTFRIEIDTLLAFAKWEIEMAPFSRSVLHRINITRGQLLLHASRVIERSLSVIVE